MMTKFIPYEVFSGAKNMQIDNNMFKSEPNFPYEISSNNFNYENNNEDSSPPYESFKIRTQIEEAAKNMIGDMSQIISNIANEEKNFKNKSLELELKYNNRIKEIEYNKNNTYVKNRLITVQLRYERKDKDQVLDEPLVLFVLPSNFIMRNDKRVLSDSLRIVLRRPKRK